jgi:hypothetical protein
MSQPVKLSDALVLDARQAGEVFQRSIAGQVEFWARLGRSVEESLDGRQVMALAREKSTVPLSELVGNLGTAQSSKRLTSYLETLPFPHYAAHPKKAGLLIRTEEDGQRSVGRFVNRQFIVDETVELAVGDVDETGPTAATL